MVHCFEFRNVHLLESPHVPVQQLCGFFCRHPTLACERSTGHLVIKILDGDSRLNRALVCCPRVWITWEREVGAGP